MVTSSTGRRLIESFESCRLTAYRDQRGIWSIGWGHTGPEVIEGLVWTQEQADAQLGVDLGTAEAVVNGGLKVAVTQNNFDAMVSLTFNIGGHDFQTSSVLRLVNQNQLGDASEPLPAVPLESPPTNAADAFLLWIKITDPNGILVVDPDLVNRRTAERALFLTPPTT